MDIDALLHARDEVFLAETGWFSDASPEEIESAYAEFSAAFAGWLEKLSGRLGPPTVTRSSNPELAEELYCEAFELAAWPKDGGYQILMWGQHDRETPVFISFGYREANIA